MIVKATEKKEIFMVELTEKEMNILKTSVKTESTRKALEEELKILLDNDELLNLNEGLKNVHFEFGDDE